eukprot:CAMPEP_0194506966 /NCGR_PEP_ID=MMETSP0253-20130528/35692_1 /TAXON_ID=2966 /ORGANISM="Noctiluca scintillans" /LENGTH=234 /DNA_ID=CAMNT_0039349767 /DNA_START=39 /DNA_END=740 /DNA_ORIENTATION=+
MEERVHLHISCCLRRIEELENALSIVKLSMKNMADGMFDVDPALPVKMDTGVGPMVPQRNVDMQIVPSCQAQFQDQVYMFEDQSAAVQIKSPRPVAPHWCFIMHPDGRCHMYWNLVGLICIFFQVFSIPFQLCFGVSPQYPSFYWWVSSVMDLYFVLDVPACACTGLKDKDGKVCMKWRTILEKYICTGRIFMDMVASIPWEWLPSSNGPLRFTKSLQILKMTRVLKSLRLLRL